LSRNGLENLGLRFLGGFDRDLRLMMLSMSFRRISMGFLMVVRAIYFYLLGFNEVEIGLLLSIATLVSALQSIVFGFLSDRFGRKPFLVMGGIFATLRMVIFALFTDFWMLALGQGIGAMGEGAGAGQPVVSGYISDKTDIIDRPSVFSTIAVANAIAATFGSLMAGLPKFLETSFGFDVIAAHKILFWIGAFGGLVSLLFVFLMKEAKTEKVMRTASEADTQEGPRRYPWGAIAKFSLVRSTSGLGWGFIESMMSLYFFLRFGVGGEVLGPIYAVARFLSVFSYLLVPMLVDRYGDIPTIVASRIATAVLAAAFSLTTWYPLAIILLVVFRVLMQFTMPIRQTFATGIVDPEEIATAIGISNFSRMSVRVLAPPIVGYLFRYVSLSLPFMMGAGLLAVNGLLYKVFFQPKNGE
jgi:MFS family permease